MLVRQRCAWGLTREYIADKCQCSLHTIINVERGMSKASVDLLSRWAEVLGFELTIKPKREY